MADFSVERVEDKRMVNGRTEYFLKWNGYPRSENTWEPAENLDCQDLIANFEESLQNSKETKKRMSISSTPGPIRSKLKSFLEDDTKKEKKLHGFDRGLEPAKILGVTDSNGQLIFLIKWKGCDHADLVPAKLANIRCPQLVIQFYEERLIWHTGSDNGNGNSGNLASYGELGSAGAGCGGPTNGGDDEKEKPQPASPAVSVNQDKNAMPEENSELNNGQPKDDE
ncbi:chromobox protein homolog 3-like [Drosophila biarmipes]|uniref:chromobox protein homolog 3-like n=1 Tax=Drosophila biarmipes TaxID=125945 RepID=UPI001CDB0954|nr:chromobox protein homolog 3-like [Drosophila biarmipes]